MVSRPRQNPQNQIYEESALFVNLAFSAEKPEKQVQAVIRRCVASRYLWCVCVCGVSIGDSQTAHGSGVFSRLMHEVYVWLWHISSLRLTLNRVVDFVPHHANISQPTWDTPKLHSFQSWPSQPSPSSTFARPPSSRPVFGVISEATWAERLSDLN